MPNYTEQQIIEILSEFRDHGKFNKLKYREIPYDFLASVDCNSILGIDRLFGLRHSHLKAFELVSDFFRNSDFLKLHTLNYNCASLKTSYDGRFLYYTPLHLACRVKNIWLIALLKCYGAKETIDNNNMYPSDNLSDLEKNKVSLLIPLISDTHKIIV